MKEVSVVIPNFNGMAYIASCLDSLRSQSFGDFELLVVDNGSTDGSRELIEERYREVQLIALKENTGFCHAVNVGIRACKTSYVILLNNDTQVHPEFVKTLLAAMQKRPKAFSCAARMVQMYDRDKIDDAGDFYNALGWGFARGKGKDQTGYRKPCRIFAACAGAAIYRKAYLAQTGLFDEAHFAYLEDIDIGYRANIMGYENWYEPEAVVYHAGSGTSGSQYNVFKVGYSARNNVYLIYKNMPLLQLLMNLPFLTAGFLIKLLFFGLKGLGKEYVLGIKNGFCLSARGRKEGKKVPFAWKHLRNYVSIQLQLWWNIVRRFTG